MHILEVDLNYISLMFYMINIYIYILKIILGVTLDKTKGTEVWDPDVKPDANDSTHVFRGEHTLLVKQVIFYSIILFLVNFY